MHRSLPLRRSALAASFIALLAAIPPPSSSASTKTWVGPDNGTWSTATNWAAPGAPASGDDVIIGTAATSGLNIDVTYDGVETGLFALNSLTLNGNAVRGFATLNQSAASSALVAYTENLGTTQTSNSYNQSAGTNTTRSLNLGIAAASNCYYNLSGTGQLILQDDYINEKIGVSGYAVFTQTGGTHTLLTTRNPNIVDPTPNPIDAFDQALTLGVNAGSMGFYNLQGGTLQVAYEQIGYGGNGTFSQSGGTNNVNELLIGGFTSTGKGVYNLTGGTLNTPYVFVRNNGTFNYGAGTSPSCLIDITSGGTLKFVAANPVGIITKVETGGSVQLQGSNAAISSCLLVGGVIQNGSSTPATLTFTSPINNPGGNLKQDGGSIIDGAGGKLSLVFTTAPAILLGSTNPKADAVNTYSGTTTLAAGTGLVQAESPGAFSPNSDFIVNAGGLNNGGYNVTLGSLAGTGGMVSVIGGSMTAGGTNLSTTYSGQIEGTGTLVKTGTGGLTLSGGGSFTGTLSVQGGSVTVGVVNGVPSGATVSLGVGGTFNVNNSQTLASLSSGDLSSVKFAGGSTLTVGGGNTDFSQGAIFSGVGTLAKTGSGTLSLGYGPSDTFANTDSMLTIAVNAGHLTFNKAAGTNAVAGPLTINGGTVTWAVSNQIADPSVVTLTGGTLNLAGYSEMVGGLAGTGGTINLGGGTLTVAQGTAGSVAAGLTGLGTFIKTGTADLTLTSTSGYGGLFNANAGRLILQGPVAATGLTANNGGTLRLDSASANLDGGAILANTGGTVEYSNATVTNGFLRGTGTHSILASGTSTFNNVTTYNSTVISQNGSAAFNTFTNGGTLGNNAPLVFNGGTNSTSGVINVNSTFSTQDFSTGGVITINNGGTLGNTVGNLVAGGGSRTTINSGGVLATAAGTSIELNGALLVNNGTQNGVLDVNYGSTARGSGVFGTVNVGTGGRFGGNSISGAFGLNVGGRLRVPPVLGSGALPLVGPPLSVTAGTVTVGGLLLASGSSVAINVQNAQGDAGTGYDTIYDHGALTLNGTGLPGEQIIISLGSLNANGNPGLAENFDSSRMYQFTLITADGGITGFSANEFAVDASGFTNPLNGGSFSVAESGNSLLLDFIPSAVPEPAMALPFGLMLVYLVIRQRTPSRLH